MKAEVGRLRWRIGKAIECFNQGPGPEMARASQIEMILNLRIAQTVERDTAYEEACKVEAE